MPRFVPRSRVFLILVQLLVMAFIAIAIPVSKTPVSDEGGGKQYLAGGAAQSEVTATDTDSGGELPGLLRTHVLRVETPFLPLRDNSSVRLARVVVIHQATRAPPTA